MTGELIGRGRDCDVFAAGSGRVVRRSRAGRSTETEALTMQHCAAHGYPVPEVFDADGPDIVMQRLDGPTMLAVLSIRPWTIRSNAQLLADLIERLDRVPLPDHELPAIDAGADVLVHLDLHPGNVVLTADGPVVIDWSNASVGMTGLDAANTWLTVAAGRPDGSIATRTLVAAGGGCSSGGSSRRSIGAQRWRRCRRRCSSACATRICPTASGRRCRHSSTGSPDRSARTLEPT